MEFRLLGRFEAEHDGRLLELGRRRERCLLALLLLDAGRVIPTDRLIDLLWDGDAPDTARASLHTHLSRLRGRLDVGDRSPRLVTTAGGYLIDVDPQRVDAHRFRSLLARAGDETDPDQRCDLLRRAVALWRGPLLADVAPPRLRERVGADLTELRLLAIESLADAELARGHEESLIAELTAWCAEYPLREQLTGQLMLALYRSGRQAEALAAYQRLGTRLADELGIDPGPQLRALYASVLRHDPRLMDPPTWVRAAGTRPGNDPEPGAPVPAQLPPAVTCFTGRDDVLELLDQLVSQRERPVSPVVISALAGVGGVGKTAVAVHWAHGVADRFPDGQLYVNLRGYDESPPLSPVAALESFLRALDVRPSGAALSLDELAARFRTALAGRRMLVLLDNARSAEQVRPLLPGTPGCLVLVTSRDDLAGLVARDGARRLALDCLSETDGVRLLERILGVERVAAEPDAAVDLVRRCGGLPLALRVVAERAARREDLGLDAIALELADSARRLDLLDVPGDPVSAVRGVFSWSYRALPESAARLFRLLGLHPAGEFGAPAALCLCGDPGTGAAELAALVDGHLVEPAGPDRYRLHDLVRLYAAECAEADEPRSRRGDAVRRLLSWYLHNATAAARVINPRRVHPDLTAPLTQVLEFTAYDDALSWLDTERANLVAAVTQAADAGEHETAWQLAIALWDLFTLRDYRTDWIASHEVALSSARHVGDPQVLSWVLLHLAAGYGQSGKHHEAMDCLRQALDILQEAGDRRGQASVLHNLGVTYEQLGRLDEAMDHFQRGLVIYTEGGHSSGQGSGLNSIGNLHTRMGQHAEAAGCQLRALALFQQAGNAFGEGDALADLSLAQRELGRLEEATESAEQALSVARRAGYRFGEAKALDALAHTRRLGGDPDGARRYWLEARAILAELGDPLLDEVQAALRSL